VNVTASIACMATAQGVIVEVRGEESTVSIILDRDAVARLVMLLAQADDKHQKLGKRSKRK
jgi:hypothetical protein